MKDTDFKFANGNDRALYYVPQLTLDTSCIVSLLRRDNTPINELQALDRIKIWEEQGMVIVWISEKSRTEAQINLQSASLNNKNDNVRYNKWLDTLSLLNKYPTATNRWILGVSKLGVDTTLASDSEGKDYSEIKDVVFLKKNSRALKKGDIFDIAILYEHYLHRNDFFLTRDKKCVEKSRVRTELMKRWGIRVVDPVEAVCILRFHYGLCP